MMFIYNGIPTYIIFRTISKCINFLNNNYYVKGSGIKTKKIFFLPISVVLICLNKIFSTIYNLRKKRINVNKQPQHISKKKLKKMKILGF